MYWHLVAWIHMFQLVISQMKFKFVQAPFKGSLQKIDFIVSKYPLCMNYDQGVLMVVEISLPGYLLWFKTYINRLSDKSSFYNIGVFNKHSADNCCYRYLHWIKRTRNNMGHIRVFGSFGVHSTPAELLENKIFAKSMIFE